MSVMAPPSMRSLPAPSRHGIRSLESCLDLRRSIRHFSTAPLSDANVGQLLWAVQGFSEDGRPVVPSAGGLGGLEVHLVDVLGIWRYQAAQQGLALERAGDMRAALSKAAGGQECIAEAPITVVLVGVDDRIEARYGRARGARYVILEAGHAAQNLLLQATALDLGAVPVGAFDDDEIRRLLELPGGRNPLYLIPVGIPTADQ